MTTEQFDDLLTDRIRKIEDVLASKAKEYARGDRLHNFKRAGRIGDTTPAQALKGMWLKHITSVFDLIDDDANHKPIPAPILDEKIGDAINYLILLEAILVESSENKRETKPATVYRGCDGCADCHPQSLLHPTVDGKWLCSRCVTGALPKKDKV